MDKYHLRRLFKARRKAIQRLMKRKDNPSSTLTTEELDADEGYALARKAYDKARAEAWKEGLAISIDVDSGELTLVPRKP